MNVARESSGSALALSLRGIRKRFGATVALAGADLEVQRGTLHAVLGENGAGKTTLMSIAFGAIRAEEGTLLVEGVERRWRSTADAIAAGIGMVHQHFLLVGAMTVAENVSLGDRGFVRGFDARRTAARVRRIAEESGLMLDPSALVSGLSVAAQQRLEIVKALARDVRLLILDEPTAVLSPKESQELYAWLRRFVASGRTVVLVTHKVREALAIADAVTVLRRGRTMLHGAGSALTEGSVVSALLGDSPTQPVEQTAPPGGGAGAVVMSCESVSVVDARGAVRLRDASLEVRAGEVVAVAGVEGAGQHELLHVLAGRLAPSAGRVRLPEHVGFVPEDRLRDALIPAMTLVENLALKEAGAARGLVPWRDYTDRARSIVRDYGVLTDGVTSRASALSGGNQQRFVLGRELEGQPQALVVENPTRGLDIRASAHVFDRLRSARSSGVAVLVHSSDLDELLSIADRMVVCFNGRLVPVPADAESAARAMVGLE